MPKKGESADEKWSIGYVFSVYEHLKTKNLWRIKKIATLQSCTTSNMQTKRYPELRNENQSAAHREPEQESSPYHWKHKRNKVAERTQ